MIPRSWRDSMTLSILGWLFVAVLVACSTSVLLLWLLGWPSLPRSTEFTTAETLDLLKIALAVVAGFGGVVILSVNHRRQRFTEKAHVLAEGQEKREQTKLLNERFAAAAEQLAHERAQVRLAGVYALAGLADDWDEGRQKCVELLIAYLRLAQSDDRAPGAGEEEVVATIYRAFRERLRRSDRRWAEVNLDFTGMTFFDADFSDLRFTGTVTFDGATFTGEATSFANTWFGGTLSCHGTEFAAEMTNFRGAWFDGPAEFVGTRFRTSVDLRNAWIDGGTVDFYQCAFDGQIQCADIAVQPGELRFEHCVLTGSSADFDTALVGAIDHRGLVDVLDVLLGRAPTSRTSRLSITNCELRDCQLTMDDVFMANGRVVITDLALHGGELRVRPAEFRHPSLLVRRIDARDATVDVPVPRRIWRAAPAST